MIWNIILSTLFIIAAVLGMYAWAYHVDEYVNKVPTQCLCPCSNVTQPVCHLYKPGPEGQCSFSQTVISLFPYFFCIGIIAICISVIYSSCRPVVM
jgi:hypothetical protein